MPRPRPPVSSRLRSRNSPGNSCAPSEQTYVKEGSISNNSVNEIAFSPQNDTMIYLDEIRNTLSFDRRSEHEKEQSLLEEANKLAYTLGEIKTRSSNFYRANVAAPVVSKRKRHLMHYEPIFKTLPTTFIIHRHLNSYSKVEKEKVFCSPSPTPAPLSPPSPSPISPLTASPPPASSSSPSATSEPPSFNLHTPGTEETPLQQPKTSSLSEEEKKRRRRVRRESEFRLLTVDIAKIPDINAPRATRSHTQPMHTNPKENKVLKRSYNSQPKLTSSPSVKKVRVGRPKKIKVKRPSSDNPSTTCTKSQSGSINAGSAESFFYVSNNLTSQNTASVAAKNIVGQPHYSEAIDTVDNETNHVNINESGTETSTASNAANMSENVVNELDELRFSEASNSKAEDTIINNPGPSNFIQSGSNTKVNEMGLLHFDQSSLEAQNPTSLNEDSSGSEFSDCSFVGPRKLYSRRKPSRRLATFKRNKENKGKEPERSPSNSESGLEQLESETATENKNNSSENLDPDLLPSENLVILNKNASLSKRVTFSRPVVADSIPKRIQPTTLSAVIRPSVIPLPLIPTVPKDTNINKKDEYYRRQRRLFVHSRYITNEEAVTVAQSVYRDRLISADDKLVKNLQKNFEKYRTKLKRIFDDLSRVLDVRQKEMLKEFRILKLFISDQMTETVLKSVWGYWIEDPYIGEDMFYECEASVSLLKEVTVQAVIYHYKEKYGLLSSNEHIERIKQLDRITRALNLPECEETQAT